MPRLQSDASQFKTRPTSEPIRGPGMSREASTQGVNEPSEEAIRERAYEIYLRRGGEPGRDGEDWEQARRELAGRHDRKQ